MNPPSGEQHVIEGAGYRAVVVECGAALRSLTYQGRDLVAGFAEDAMPSGGRGQVLMPWPNRIRDGHYSFGGSEYQLPSSEPARHNASHGLVRWTSWRRLGGDEAAVLMGYRLMAQTGYPWTLDLEVAYSLDERGLGVSVTAANLADSPAPFAYGAHPYLTTGAPKVDADRLVVPADARLTTDSERKLPARLEPVAGTAYDLGDGAIGDLVLDDPLRRKGDGSVLLEGDAGGVELWAGPEIRWFQVYTGDDTSTPRTALAVEPMTSPPDAFNSGTDLVVLEPGAVFRTRWGIRRV